MGKVSSSKRPSSSPNGSSKTSRSRKSDESHGSQSTTPTSLYEYDSLEEFTCALTQQDNMYTKRQSRESYGINDVSPSTSLCPRSSVESYASTTVSEADIAQLELDSIEEEEDSYPRIPPLPVYRHETSEPHVRPASPREFGELYPDFHRMSIRHDEFTSDGNMNLRVDVVLTGRRRTAIQLFHLRMYNLEKRDFSLRRYCRDSGREVCNSKRTYHEPDAAKTIDAADGRPSLQRSVTTAIKTLTRTNSGTPASGWGSRPSTAHSWGDGDDEKSAHRTFSSISLASSKSHGSTSSKGKPKPKRRFPTNSIKLEFANYARVDVKRRDQRYDFEWWGHQYSWKMTQEKLAGYSFQLIRDGDSANPVAFIVPEARSLSQVYEDKKAGGWIPPCHMWIEDKSVMTAATDVADTIMATGLMALVDDCINETWEGGKTAHQFALPLTSKTFHVPRTVMPPLFRRNSGGQKTGPTRLQRAVSVY